MKRPYGSGTVEKSRGKFRARGAPLPGGRRPPLGLFDVEQDAHDACDAHALVTSGAGLMPGTMTLRAWGVKFLARREAGTCAGQEEPARDIKSDRSRWKNHIESAEFIDWPLPTISRREGKEWLLELAKRDAADVRAKDPKKRRKSYRRPPRKISAQTRKHCLNLIRKAFDEAVEDELITANPFKGLKAPKVKAGPFEWLALTEQNRIERCQAIAEAERLRAMFAWGTGIRQFDQWTMKLVDLRLDQDNPDVYFWCHKRQKMTRVPLFGVALRAVKRWLELLPTYCPKNERRLVWPLPSGCQRQKSKSYGWSTMLKLAGIRKHVTWHELRDTCGSSLVSGLWGRAWRLEEVKDMLDHSSIEVTERYAHLAPQVLDEAARATIGPHSAHVAKVIEMPKQRKTKGRATSDSNGRPSAPEAGGELWSARELADLAGKLRADSEALVRAQLAGDVTATIRLGLDLATAILDASADAEAAAAAGGSA
jgi:site-specific recombinase XerD